MKLLILTQKVNQGDDVLGFFHGWIREFARNVEQVTVICLEEGSHSLPANVAVRSLGKESGRSRAKYLRRFYSYVWSERRNYDVVFCHMNPEYVILGGWLWRLLGKTVTLWYAHGHPSWQLKASVPFANYIFTSVPHACRIDTPKRKVVGQGIDTDAIVPNAAMRRHDPFRAISVGRISPSKDYATAIRAAEILTKKGMKVQIDLIGGPGLAGQQAYFEEMKQMVSDKQLEGVVRFLGSIPNPEIPSHLKESDAFLNMTHTGSLDKAGVEGMAAGLPLITCGEAFEAVLGSYAPSLMFPKRDAEALADRIERVARLPQPEFEKLSRDMRQIVLADHSLANFVRKILAIIEQKAQ